MDKIPAQRAGQVKKMSTERIRSKLLQAGYDVDEVDKMSRAQLMESMAEVIRNAELSESEGEDKEQLAATGRVLHDRGEMIEQLSDMQLKQRELAVRELEVQTQLDIQ